MERNLNRFFTFFLIIFISLQAQADVSIDTRDDVDDVSPTTYNEGESYNNRMTPKRAKHVNLRDQNGNELGTTTNPIQAALPAIVSSVNSTTSTLGSGASFTGSFEDIRGVSTLSVTICPSHESATNGFIIEFSSDGTNVDANDMYTIPACSGGAAGKQFSFGATTRYYRIRYTNGSSAQSSFRMQTVLHYVPIKPSSHRIEDSTTGDDDSELVKSVITGKAPDGSYKNVRVDADGNFIITALTGFGADFAFGDVTTAATTQVPVRRTTYTEPGSNGQRSFSSTDVDDDGSPADTGARTLHFTYLDATGAGPFDETITLNGTTCVATVATDIAFIEHIEIKTAGSTGSNEGTISMFKSAACGGGTIGTIGANANQSFWAHHYVPTGEIANVTGMSVSHNGTTVGSGGVFILKAKDLSVADSIERQVSDFVRLYGQASTSTRNYGSPIKVTGPARLTIYVTPETSSSTVYRGSIDFFEP